MKTENNAGWRLLGALLVCLLLPQQAVRSQSSDDAAAHVTEGVLQAANLWAERAGYNIDD